MCACVSLFFEVVFFACLCVACFLRYLCFLNAEMLLFSFVSRVPSPSSQGTWLTLWQPLFQVLAAYNFAARGNHEVSIRAGEPVRVLEPHDKRGNPDWSLVEAAGGQRGYVPSNYLTMMPQGAGRPGSSRR